MANMGEVSCQGCLITRDGVWLCIFELRRTPDTSSLAGRRLGWYCMALGRGPGCGWTLHFCTHRRLDDCEIAVAVLANIPLVWRAITEVLYLVTKLTAMCPRVGLLEGAKELEYKVSITNFTYCGDYIVSLKIGAFFDIHAAASFFISSLEPLSRVHNH